MIKHIDAEMPSGVSVQIWQMFKDGPTWDGDLVCKTSRKWLVNQGMAESAFGFNYLTADGVGMAVSLEMDAAKDAKRDWTK